MTTTVLLSVHEQWSYNIKCTVIQSLIVVIIDVKFIKCSNFGTRG